MDAEAAISEPSSPQRGFLGAVERIGNLLPDPAMIFVWLIQALVVLSVLGSWLGWSASLPYGGTEAPHWGELAGGVLTYRATSLLTEENVARLFVEMPKTFTGFAPLGLILTIILGAAVAERAGTANSASARCWRRCCPMRCVSWRRGSA